MEEIKNTPELRFADLAPSVWEKLQEIKRTGWLERGVENPESVQEHTVALRDLAHTLFDTNPELSEEDKKDLLDMLEVHDWPEALVGDEVVLDDGSLEKIKQKEEKAKREHDAMIKISESLAEAGESVMNLWIRFETSEDSVADLARQLDKYQAVEKALEYEKAQGKPLFQEFKVYSEKYITHPVLVQRLKELE